MFYPSIYAMMRTVYVFTALPWIPICLLADAMSPANSRRDKDARNLHLQWDD
jgi:hypothetical protein